MGIVIGIDVGISTTKIVGLQDGHVVSMGTSTSFVQCDSDDIRNINLLIGNISAHPLPSKPIINKGFQDWNYLVLNMVTWLEGRDTVREF